MENKQDPNLSDSNQNNNNLEISLENPENKVEEIENPLCNNADDEFTFNIVITPVDHKIVDQNINISNIKNYNDNSPVHRSNSFENVNFSGSTKRTTDSDNSTEDNENSIKGKSIDEIYETCLKKKQQKNEKYFKHSDVDKLKEILISKGKFNKDNNIINKLFGTEK